MLLSYHIHVGGDGGREGVVDWMEIKRWTVGCACSVSVRVDRVVPPPSPSQHTHTRMDGGRCTRDASGVSVRFLSRVEADLIVGVEGRTALIFMLPSLNLRGFEYLCFALRFIVCAVACPPSSTVIAHGCTRNGVPRAFDIINAVRHAFLTKTNLLALEHCRTRKRCTSGIRKTIPGP